MFIKPKNRALLALLLLLFLFFRFDISYNLWPHRVQIGETLWSILEKKVFYSSTITGISISYLKSQYPQFNWDNIEKNVNDKDGYKIFIWLNKINIQALDDKFLVREVPLLPISALRNHALEVLSYDLILLTLALFIYVNLQENNFKPTLNVIKNIIFIPGLLVLGILLIAVITFVLSAWIASFFRPHYILVTPERIIQY